MLQGWNLLGHLRCQREEARSTERAELPTKDMGRKLHYGNAQRKAAMQTGKTSS